MDEGRNVRFLIPPFFFLLSVFLAAHFSDVDVIAMLQPLTPQQILAVATGIGAATIPMGYLLTSISILLLNGLARFCGARYYEAHLSSEEVLNLVSKEIKAAKPVDRTLELYAVATYDHAILPKQVHQWIQRRWNAFNIAAHSCTAIVLAQPAVLLVPKIHYTVSFAFSGAGMFAVLGINGYVAWRQVMRMIEFQTSLQKKRRTRAPDVSG